MGLLENIGNEFVKNVTASLRRFTAFLFVLFTAGVIYGSIIAQTNPAHLPYAIAIPIILAVFAYFNTAFAVILFILLAVFLFLF